MEDPDFDTNSPDDPALFPAEYLKFQAFSQIDCYGIGPITARKIAKAIRDGISERDVLEMMDILASNDGTSFKALDDSTGPEYVDRAAIVLRCNQNNVWQPMSALRRS